MKNIKLILLLGLIAIVLAGCSESIIQTDPVNLQSELTLKAKGDATMVPWKATFELASTMIKMGPPITYMEINGEGKVSHMGLTDLFIDQQWTRMEAEPGFSIGQGEITFTAANGDMLYASYSGSANHNLDPYPPIEASGVFNGGTGRFMNAEGEFLWHGKYNMLIKSGTVIAEGKIKYKRK